MDHQPDFDVLFAARRRFLRQAAARVHSDAGSSSGFATLYDTDDLREAVSRLWSDLATQGVICAANGFRTEQFGLDERLRPQLALDDGYRIVAPDSHAIRPDRYRSDEDGDDFVLTRQLADLIDLLAGEALDLAEHHNLRAEGARVSLSGAPTERDIVGAGARGRGRPSTANRQVIQSPIGESLVIEHKPIDD
jgi:hypothetical protein